MKEKNLDKVVRTPVDRFANLPDYPFEEHYVDVDDGLRCHYVDEGPKDGKVVLLLHGEPSWSFLYRKMIPILAEAGFRAIAPDLIGFGKSDKYVDRSAYSYHNHLQWLTTFIQNLGLKDVVLFCQDWGGLLGLRLVSAMPDIFSHVVASNTALPTGEVKLPEAFKQWVEFSQKSPEFDVGRVIDMSTTSELSEEIINAYRAPFPTEEYKAGARVFPALVPVNSDDAESVNNIEAWGILRKWTKPFLTVFGEHDPVMKGAERAFKKFIPGAQGQKHQILSAGHFIQEDKGENLAHIIIEFYQQNK